MITPAQTIDLDLSAVPREVLPSLAMITAQANTDPSVQISILEAMIANEASPTAEDTQKLISTVSGVQILASLLTELGKRNFGNFNFPELFVRMILATPYGTRTDAFDSPPIIAQAVGCLNGVPHQVLLISTSRGAINVTADLVITLPDKPAGMLYGVGDLMEVLIEFDRTRKGMQFMGGIPPNGWTPSRTPSWTPNQPFITPRR